MSEVSTFVKLSKYLLGNSASRLFLNFSSRPCRKCDRVRVEQILDRYIDKDNPRMCTTCLLTSVLGRLLLDTGRFLFKAKKSDLRSLISDIHARRGLISVLRGLADYGIRRPQTTGAPFLVVWNYTYACNLRCKHCYSSAGKPSPEELTTEEALRTVDQLADAYVVAVSFSGGEPLMRRDFFDVARYAADKGLYVSLATNGTLIDDDVAGRLRDSGVEYVDVSLDGANPETHDIFRGVPGSFERAIRGIKACVKAGLYTCVAMTVTKHNLSEVPKVVELAKKLKAKRFLAFNFVPTGRGKVAIDLDPTPQEREAVLKALYCELIKSVTGKGGIETFSTAPQFARVAIESFQTNESIIPAAHYGGLVGSTKLLADFIGGCGAGRIYCSLSPEGYVEPCVFLPIRVGDLKKESFEDVWRNSKVFNELRDKDLLKGSCADCKYRFVCGGCRARAYGYCGDYLASDPGCIYERESMRRWQK